MKIAGDSAFGRERGKIWRRFRESLGGGGRKASAGEQERRGEGGRVKAPEKVDGAVKGERFVVDAFSGCLYRSAISGAGTCSFAGCPLA